MLLRILSPGLFASVQDAGRPGLRSSGVPVGGAADGLSHQLANLVLGNDTDAPTLEIAGNGFSAYVEMGAWMSFCGIGGSWKINGQRVGMGRTVWVPAGATLEKTGDSDGQYHYIGVENGWIWPGKNPGEFPGPNFSERGLQKNDCLVSAEVDSDFEDTEFDHAPYSLENQDVINPGATPEALVISKFFVEPRAFYPAGSPDTVHVIPGPEFDWWPGESAEQFFSERFSISAQSNRMGLRLTGRALPPENGAGEMLSSAVWPGTVQVPPDGNPIVLLADCQTTGGYPRFGQVIAADLPKVAQMRPGQHLRFEKTTLEAAESLLFEQQTRLERMKIALQYVKN